MANQSIHYILCVVYTDKLTCLLPDHCSSIVCLINITGAFNAIMNTNIHSRKLQA